MSKHSITVDGNRYTFELTGNFPAFVVYAPGLLPFHAQDLDDARDILRGAYAKEADLDE